MLKKLINISTLLVISPLSLRGVQMNYKGMDYNNFKRYLYALACGYGNSPEALQQRSNDYVNLMDSINNNCMNRWQQVTARLFDKEWNAAVSEERPMNIEFPLWNNDSNVNIFELIVNVYTKDVRMVLKRKLKIIELFKIGIFGATFSDFKTNFPLDDETDRDILGILEQLFNFYNKVKERGAQENIRNLMPYVNKDDAFWEHVDNLYRAIKEKNIEYLKTFKSGDWNVYRCEKNVYGLRLDEHFNFVEEDLRQLKEIGKCSLGFLKWLFFPRNGSVQDFQEVKDFDMKLNVPTFDEAENIPNVLKGMKKYWKNVISRNANPFDEQWPEFCPSIALFMQDNAIRNSYLLLGQELPNYDRLLTNEIFIRFLRNTENHQILIDLYRNFRLTPKEIEERIGFIKLVSLPEFDEIIDVLTRGENPWSEVWNAYKGNAEKLNLVQNIFGSPEGLAWMKIYSTPKVYRYLKMLSIMKKGFSWDFLIAFINDGEIEYNKLQNNRDFLSTIMNNPRNKTLLINAFQQVDWLTPDEKAKRIVFLKLIKNNFNWDFLIAFINNGEIEYNELRNNHDFLRYINNDSDKQLIINVLQGANWLTPKEIEERIGFIKLVSLPEFNEIINVLTRSENPWSEVWKAYKRDAEKLNLVQNIFGSPEGLAWMKIYSTPKVYRYLKMLSIMKKGFSWDFLIAFINDGEIEYNKLQNNRDFLSTIMNNPGNKTLLINAFRQVDWLTPNKKTEIITFIQNGREQKQLKLKEFIAKKYFGITDNREQIDYNEMTIMKNFTIPCIAVKNKPHEEFCLLKRFNESMDESKLTKLALSTLLRFMGTFYSPNSDVLLSDEEIQRFIDNDGLYQTYRDQIGILSQLLSLPYEFSGKVATIVAHCGGIMERGYINHFCDVRMANGIEESFDKSYDILTTKYTLFLRALFGKLFKDLGEHQRKEEIGHIFNSFWDAPINVFSGNTKNMALTIFECMEALIFAYNSPEADRRLKKDCCDVAYQIFQPIFHYAVHCDSGRSLALKNVSEFLLKTCISIHSAKDNVLALWNKYCEAVNKSLVNDLLNTHYKLFGRYLLANLEIVCSFNDDLLVNVLSFKYDNEIEDYSEGHFIKGRLENHNESAMIIGSLPALLGGWNASPNNFYGCPVQGNAFASLGTVTLFTTMCYNFYLARNVFTVHALNAYYRLRGLIDNPKESPTSLEEREENMDVNDFDNIRLTDDVLLEFVQTTFGACFDADFILQQLVPEDINNLDLVHQDLVAFCDTILRNIMQTPLSNQEKRNVLRYLFEKYGFFHRK